MSKAFNFNLLGSYLQQVSLGGTLVAKKEAVVFCTLTSFFFILFIEHTFDNLKILPYLRRDINLQDKETISHTISFQLHLSAVPTKLRISKVISFIKVMISFLRLLFGFMLINSDVSAIFKVILLFLTA